jgi:Outer membrane protein beta-barrel domain
MKKAYFIAILLLLVGSFNAHAQLKLGLKGGLNLPSINAQGGSISLDAATGWHGGGMVELKLPIIGIQADVLYSQVGISNIDLAGVIGDLKHTTLDIPIVAKLYLLKIFTIQLGPQFKFVTSSKIGDFSVKDQIDNNTVDLVAGLGVNLGPLDIHGRFIFPSTTNISSLGEYKSSNIQLSVGFWLKK